jgi:hypothetical protein
VQDQGNYGSPSPETSPDKAALKAAKRQVKTAGTVLRNAERTYKRRVDEAQRQVRKAERTAKIAELPQGRATLYDDRVVVDGLTIPLVPDGMNVAVTPTLFGKGKVHMTVSGPESFKTVKVPPSELGTAQNFAAAVQVAANRSTRVRAERAALVQQLEREVQAAREQTEAVDTARAELARSERETGLSYQQPHTLRKVILSAVAAVLVIGTISAITNDDTKATDSTASGTVAANLADDASVTPAVDPAGSSPSPTATAPPTTIPPTTAKPAAVKPEKPKAVKPEKKRPVVHYRTLTSRQWDRIVRDPDGHLGETVIVYGVVRQADAATGTDSIRADVDGVRRKRDYFGYYTNYDTNTVLTSDSVDLTELLEGDVFKAKVIVGGALEYQTTLGGQLTVPGLLVVEARRIDREER